MLRFTGFQLAPDLGTVQGLGRVEDLTPYTILPLTCGKLIQKLAYCHLTASSPELLQDKIFHL